MKQPNEGGSMRYSKKMNKDDLLVYRILEKIKWDARISNSDLLVKAKNGEVTLLGYFDEAYRKEALLRIVETTQGVNKIDDQTQVLNDYCRTDIELQTIISKQVLAFPFLKGEWIDFSVSNGVVKFEGIVFRPRFKAFVARIAWELSGIRDCLNLIKISSAPQVAQQKAYPLADVYYTQRMAM